MKKYLIYSLVATLLILGIAFVATNKASIKIGSSGVVWTYSPGSTMTSTPTFSNGQAISVASPLIVGGISTTTIYGDGTSSNFSSGISAPFFNGTVIPSSAGSPVAMASDLSSYQLTSDMANYLPLTGGLMGGPIDMGGSNLNFGGSGLLWLNVNTSGLQFNGNNILQDPITVYSYQLPPFGGDFSISATATSSSIGGSALLAGQCSSATTTISTADETMTVLVTPATTTNIGDSAFWKGRISGPNEVTVSVCESVAGTPVASVYNIRLIK